MADVATLFLATAVLTFVGFAAGRLFQRTRIPDVLLLLGLGLLVGPVNRWAVAHGTGSSQLADALNPHLLAAVAPYIAGLALVVLLFDAGMEMDFRAFRSSLGPAAVHTFPIFMLTVLGVAGLCYAVLGMPLVLGIMLGIALANVDQTVSTGLLQGMHVSPNLRAIYFVEMALYDLLSIPLLVSIIQLTNGTVGDEASSTFLRSFAVMIFVSLGIGLAAGMLWVYALRRLQGHPNSYMLTFATCLAVYGLSQLLGGSGALSVLLFGLVVGNRATILRQFESRWRSDGEHEKVQAFHDEIAFFVRTVFFVFVGASFSIDVSLSTPGTSAGHLFEGLGHGPLLLVATSFLLLLVIVLARYVPIRIAAGKRPERTHLFPVFGRGLDTAVLATLPFLAVGFVPGTAYFDRFAPWQPVFVNLALLGILLTVLASSLAVWLHDRRYPASRQTGAAPPTGPAGPGVHPSARFFQATRAPPQVPPAAPQRAPAEARPAAPAKGPLPASKERRRAK